MFEKRKVDDIKRGITSELQKSIEKLFQKELSIYKPNGSFIKRQTSGTLSDN